MKSHSILSWEVEDYLTDNNVFLNGFREVDTPASLGAYGTVISYTNLENAINKSSYTKEQWLKCIDAWKGNEYLSPTFTLLVLWTTRLIEKKFS